MPARNNILLEKTKRANLLENVWVQRTYWRKHGGGRRAP